MDLGLNGDTVLTTASSSGLGYASAESLAAEGANVVVCGRTTDRLEEAKRGLADTSGEVRAIQADLTQKGDIEALIEATVNEFGDLDHVVTSAGGVPPGNFNEMTDQQWYQAYDTLVMSLVWTLREAHPYLANEGGSVTCITSTSVREAIDGLVLSNAVRRAVIGVVKTIAREWAPTVRANAVLPGAHETARIETLVEDAVERGEHETYEEGLDAWAADIPLDRIGDPGELGDTVAFLASDRASFITGAALPVDGGTLRS